MSNLVPLQCRYVMSSSLNKDLTDNVMLQNFSVFMFFRLYFCLIKNCFSRMDSLSSFVYLRCLCAQLDEKNLLQCLHGSKAGTRTYVVKCTLYRVNTLIELIFSGVQRGKVKGVMPPYEPSQGRGLNEPMNNILTNAFNLNLKLIPLIGKPHKSTFFWGPTTKALPPPSLELSGHIFW